MKQILGIFALCLFLPGSVEGADYDASMLPLCQQLASNPDDEVLRTQFIEHRNIALIKEGLGDKFHVSFEQISDQKDRIEHYGSKLPALQRSLPQLELQAGKFLGENAVPEAMKIHLVCGMRSDGFGFSIDGKQRLFVNLALVAPDFFPSLLRHELWHVAFRARYPVIVEKYERSTNPFKRLSFIMLNEGVGHYYSFQRRVEPSMAYENWAERTDRIFILLNKNTLQLGTMQSSDELENLLFASHAGVPFWQKWAALSGAIMTYRLNKTLDQNQMRKVISAGPCQFLSRYQTEALERPAWQPVPDILLNAACEQP